VPPPKRREGTRRIKEFAQNSKWQNQKLNLGLSNSNNNNKKKSLGNSHYNILPEYSHNKTLHSIVGIQGKEKISSPFGP
jgi:hypothetical protein